MLLRALIDVVFPATCAGCGRVLVRGERQVCMHCMAGLGTTDSAAMVDNATERRLIGQVPIEAAMSLYNYTKEGPARQLVHAMKFHGNARLCVMMGRQMGLELLHSGRFDDVDVLVPVPLHWLRKLQRGYNQSLLLCRGIAEVWPRPVVKDVVVRHRYTRQQSRQLGPQRGTNVEGAFSLKHGERLAGKHVLLVDDVLTTGATLGACAVALVQTEGVRISVATLCIA